MYLIISEDGSASTSSELTKEIMECIEAGIVDIYDTACTPIKVLNPKNEWVEVGQFVSYQNDGECLS